MSSRALGERRVAAVQAGFFVARRRISPVYLLDAGAEALLLAGWFAQPGEKMGGDPSFEGFERGVCKYSCHDRTSPYGRLDIR